MHLRCIFTLLFLLITTIQAAAQKKLFKSLEPRVDTTYIEKLYDTWALRGLATFKYQNLSIGTDGNDLLRYVPTDRFSAGVGMSYKFIVLDLGIRLLFDRENFTKRFDLQTDIALQEHLIDFSVQRYEGFEEQKAGTGIGFRGDLRSWLWSVGYLYNVRNEKVSLRSVLTGNRRQLKSAGTWLVGGYFSAQDLEADSSIVGDVVQEGILQDLQGISIFSAGGSGGYAYILTLPANFYVFGAAIPGAGLVFGTINSASDERLGVRPSIKLNIRAAVGHIADRFYSGVIFDTDYFFLNPGPVSRLRYNIGMLKFVVGFRISAKDTLLEDVFGE